MIALRPGAMPAAVRAVSLEADGGQMNVQRDGRARSEAALRFEAFLADVAVLQRRPLDVVDAQIDGTLARAADVLEVDRCGLAVFSPGLQELRVERAFARGDVESIQPPADLGS